MFELFLMLTFSFRYFDLVVRLAGTQHVLNFILRSMLTSSPLSIPDIIPLSTLLAAKYLVDKSSLIKTVLIEVSCLLV